MSIQNELHLLKRQIINYIKNNEKKLDSYAREFQQKHNFQNASENERDELKKLYDDETNDLQLERSSLYTQLMRVDIQQENISTQ